MWRAVIPGAGLKGEVNDGAGKARARVKGVEKTRARKGLPAMKKTSNLITLLRYDRLEETIN